MYGVSLADMDAATRRRAKAINFGYPASLHLVSPDNLGISPDRS
jgi:hypothetical protein